MREERKSLVLCLTVLFPCVDSAIAYDLSISPFLYSTSKEIWVNLIFFSASPESVENTLLLNWLL